MNFDAEGTLMPRGCARCRDGAHWECHGCSCPCSWPDDFGGPGSDYRAAEHQAAIAVIHPYITTEQREQQWLGTYPQPSRADKGEPIIGGPVFP